MDSAWVDPASRDIHPSHNAFAIATSPGSDPDSPVLHNNLDAAPPNSLQALINTSFGTGTGSMPSHHIRDMLVDAATLADWLMLEIGTEQDTHVTRMAELSAKVINVNHHDRTDAEHTRQLIELRHQITAKQIQQLQLQLDTESQTLALKQQQNDATIKELQYKVDQASARIQ